MREPDLVGCQGAVKAWKIDDTQMAKFHIKEWGYEPGSLVTWIVHGPFHLLWSWWHVGVIHLRPIPGAPPATKQYPEAEYEFTIYTLNPKPDDFEAHKGRDYPPNIDKIEDGDITGLPGFLHPADVTFHFHKVTDEQAVKICHAAIRAIVAGHSPDSDYREWWKTSLSKTVEHFVLGVHE